MLFRVDPNSGVSLFDQLAGSIRAAAIAGKVKRGERLPPARELAASLEINVHTVLRAYQMLRDEGLVDLRPGRGAIVTATNVEDYQTFNSAMRELIDEAKRLGIPPNALAAQIREAYSE
ncbi:MAG: GntR family transcriptional regulator [Microbacteriaceae bacterium]|nr:GntR family transcriptional regulator [Cryobacterium sp.]MBX3104672.1 GntR family transcriptional regulator [Cryobacterium sp.]MCC6376528.1 GntR family transcriptional regulator [Microbacteriaceae bacterium]